MAKYAVVHGRMSPLHLGHQATIDYAITTYGVENVLVLIGSNNTPQSMRHMFSYKQRRDLVRIIYPDVKVAGIPDFPKDEDWLLTLDDMVYITFGTNEVDFVGGSEEDIKYLISNGYKCLALGRDLRLNISATEVRKRLLAEQDISDIVDERLVAKIELLWFVNWLDFVAK